ncbi:MAG: hypothetical protein K0S33_676 [Bacteroidetes bacterium]|nr:hypothetical protein [Bacteroidota bacterium]
MARQKGIIKLKGTIGDVSFYKTQDGDLARAKGGVDASRIASDPAFVRTRENNTEFGSSANSGKTLRDAVRPLMMRASDNRVVSRLTKLMTGIKNMDTASARGERTVGLAIATPAAKALIKGFNFNIKAVLGAVLFKPYQVTPATGEIRINNLIPLNDIAYPTGATHVTIRGGLAKIDFANGTYNLQLSNEENLPIDAAVNNVVLTPAPGSPGVPSVVGTDLYLLQVEFYQEVNGVQYAMKNGAYNALAIVEVQ